MPGDKDRHLAVDGYLSLEPRNSHPISSAAFENDGADPTETKQSRLPSAPRAAAPQLCHRVSAQGSEIQVASISLHVRALQMDLPGERSARFDSHNRSERIAIVRARELQARRDFRGRSLPGVEGSGWSADRLYPETRPVGANQIACCPRTACDVAEVERGQQAGRASGSAGHDRNHGPGPAPLDLTEVFTGI